MAAGKNSRVVEKRDIRAHKELRILDIKYPRRSLAQFVLRRQFFRAPS